MSDWPMGERRAGRYPQNIEPRTIVDDDGSAFRTECGRLTIHKLMKDAPVGRSVFYFPRLARVVLQGEVEEMSGSSA